MSKFRDVPLAIGHDTIHSIMLPRTKDIFLVCRLPTFQRGSLLLFIGALSRQTRFAFYFGNGHIALSSGLPPSARARRRLPKIICEILRPSAHSLSPNVEEFSGKLTARRRRRPRTASTQCYFTSLKEGRRGTSTRIALTNVRVSRLCSESISVLERNRLRTYN